MFTTPSTDLMLEGLIMGLEDDILPALGNTPKALATAFMMQSVLQGLRQTLAVPDAAWVDEHNAMCRVLRETAAALGSADGPAADRVRSRAADLGQRADLPAPPDRDATSAAHIALTTALSDTIRDLDELQRAGQADADAALQIVRGHFGGRYMTDVATITVGAGFIGRG